MEKIKIGIVGCGGIANGKHLPAISRNGNFEIVAFCDILIERAEEAKKEYGTDDARVYTDYMELVKEKDLVAVYVLTPNKSHAFISVAAMKAGKHVMCEKPMAKSYADAKLMLDTAKETGRILTIGYQNRYRNDSTYLKRACENGDLGEIYYEMALQYAMLDMDEVSLRCIIKSALCGYDEGIDYCKRFNIDYKDTLNSSSKNIKAVYYKDISFQCPIHWEVEKQTIQDEIMYIVTCEDKEINTNSMASILCINVEVPAKETLLDTIERMKSIKRFKSVRHSKIKDISFSNIQSVATEIYGVENGEEIYGTSVSFNFKGKTVVIFVASDSKENHDTIYGIIESGFHMK